MTIATAKTLVACFLAMQALIIPVAVIWIYGATKRKPTPEMDEGVE